MVRHGSGPAAEADSLLMSSRRTEADTELKPLALEEEEDGR